MKLLQKQEFFYCKKTGMREGAETLPYDLVFAKDKMKKGRKTVLFSCVKRKTNYSPKGDVFFAH